MSIIGIDLGGTRIKSGIVSNSVVEELNIMDVSSNKNLSYYLPLLKKHILHLVEKWSHDEITGIGIAFPGIVDTKMNKVIGKSGKYDDTPSLDLVKWAEQQFGLTLKMENDARLAWLAWASGNTVRKRDD